MPQIQRYCDAIAAAFKPARIFLFGSYAYGQPTEDSDVDVMVVMPKGRKATLDTAVQNFGRQIQGLSMLSFRHVCQKQSTSPNSKPMVFFRCSMARI